MLRWNVHLGAEPLDTGKRIASVICRTLRLDLRRVLDDLPGVSLGNLALALRRVLQCFSEAPRSGEAMLRAHGHGDHQHLFERT